MYIICTHAYTTYLYNMSIVILRLVSTTAVLLRKNVILAIHICCIIYYFIIIYIIGVAHTMVSIWGDVLESRFIFFVIFSRSIVPALNALLLLLLLFRRPFSKTHKSTPSTVRKSLQGLMDDFYLFTSVFSSFIFHLFPYVTYGGISRVANKTRFRVVKVLKGKRYRRSGRRPVADMQQQL